MKKKVIITVSICLAVVLLIGSAIWVSYDKFGTPNVFSLVSFGGNLKISVSDFYCS